MSALTHIVLTSLFLWFFILITMALVVFLLSFNHQPGEKNTFIRLIKRHWPMILLLILLFSLTISIPLNVLGNKEVIVNQENFKVYLKIIEAPLPTPTPTLDKSEPKTIMSLGNGLINQLLKLIRKVLD